MARWAAIITPVGLPVVTLGRHYSGAAFSKLPKVGPIRWHVDAVPDVDLVVSVRLRIIVDVITRHNRHLLDGKLAWRTKTVHIGVSL